MGGKKKEKYVPLIGITGVGDDYNVYVLSFIERVTGFAIGFIAGFLGAHIMFSVLIMSLIFGIIVGFIAIPIYKEFLQRRRTRAILMQFRDVLDSLSNSFSSGKNTPDAFEDAFNDMQMAYGQKAIMVKELLIVISGLHNNYVIEDLLKDMAARCGIDDINSFAETFAVCNRLGGNIKKIVSESRDIINEKIEIEMEIQTTITSNKNEINIMCVLPFVIISMMGMLGEDSITANTPINVIVKIVAVIMFAVAYMIGKKITDIKV